MKQIYLKELSLYIIDDFKKQKNNKTKGFN